MTHLGFDKRLSTAPHDLVRPVHTLVTEQLTYHWQQNVVPIRDGRIANRLSGWTEQILIPQFGYESANSKVSHLLRRLF